MHIGVLQQALDNSAGAGSALLVGEGIAFGANFSA